MHNSHIFACQLHSASTNTLPNSISRYSTEDRYEQIRTRRWFIHGGDLPRHQHTCEGNKWRRISDINAINLCCMFCRFDTRFAHPLLFFWPHHLPCSLPQPLASFAPSLPPSSWIWSRWDVNSILTTTQQLIRLRLTTQILPNACVDCEGDGILFFVWLTFIRNRMVKLNYLT